MSLVRSSLAICLAVVLMGGVAATSLAQDPSPAPGDSPPPTAFPVQLVAGTCAELGDVVVSLTDARFGAPVQSDDATPAAAPGYVGTVVASVVAISLTTIDLAFDDLIGQPHSIVAYPEDSVGGPIMVCGEIGGYRSGDGLVFGLSEQNESDYVGTAWLRDLGDGTTTLTVFLVSPTSERLSDGTSAASGA